MSLEFQYILSRIRMRTLEIQSDPLIDWIAMTIVEWQIMGVTWRKSLTEQGQNKRPQIGAGNTHYTNSAPARGGGNGSDRLLVDLHQRWGAWAA